jgi:hypothetical protein
VLAAAYVPGSGRDGGKLYTRWREGQLAAMRASALVGTHADSMSIQQAAGQTSCRLHTNM